MYNQKMTDNFVYFIHVHLKKIHSWTGTCQNFSPQIAYKTCSLFVMNNSRRRGISGHYAS